MSNKAYIVDGSGYIFRAFYAVAPLTNKNNFPTNALFGFTKMLVKLLKQADSRHVVIAFDSGRETFRNDMYKEYKANRAECPEELKKQMPFFREISSALGIQIVELPGFEADDVIGTIARRLQDEAEVVIVSGDKDLMQLVNENVSIFDGMKDKSYGPAEVKEKFGVLPDRVIDFLALTGDSSDNIPGLDGCGPKTALQLIEKFGDLESILKSSQIIEQDQSIRSRKKIAQSIELNRDLVRLSRKLVEIDTDSPVELQVGDGKVEISLLTSKDLFDALLRNEPNSAELYELCERFEFDSLLRELNLAVPKNREDVLGAVDYQTVYDDGFDEFIKVLSKQSHFAFDTETTSLDIKQAKIVGVGICFSNSEAFYIPVGHQNSEKKQVELARLISGLKPFFQKPEIRKTAQNLKYDYGILAEHGVEILGICFDTMIASYLLNSERGSHNLTVLARDYLGVGVIEYDEVVKGRANFSEVEIDAATRYCCEDAHLAWVLEQKLRPLIEERGLLNVLSSIEMPLIPILSRMERIGVKLDTVLLKKLSEEFEAELKKIEIELYDIAGEEFNLNSPKQLATILFDKLNLSTQGLKRTKTGISTDSSVLEKLAPLHPLPAGILRYRLLYKLKSTYLDVLAEAVSTRSGRLHAHFNQALTGTGRLSSSDPNLQNIPIKTTEGRRIRGAFIAEPGNILISADYSQIELRLLAHMSADENLKAAFARGEDIHAKTAREILSIPATQELSDEARRMGKTINFGVIYGMSGFRLARELGIPVQVANAYIEGYFARYPRVKQFFATLERNITEQGYVTTIFGRRRNITEIDSSGRDRGFVLRAAINAPIQGSAADIIKLAMVKVDQRIRKEGLKIDLILQIHDELVFETAEALKDRAIKIIQEEMEAVADFSVPLKVDLGFGRSWTEAQG